MFDVSQDGKHVIFSGYGNGGKDIYMLDLTTDKVNRVTNTPEYENYPEFSPDGNYIVYQKAKNLSSPRYLFLRSLQTGREAQLTSGTPTQDSSPSFSSDGKEIVFCRASNFVPGRSGEDTWNSMDVYVVKRNGSGLKRLTHGSYFCGLEPRFYPGNKYVIFESMPLSSDDVPMVLSRVSASGDGVTQTVVNFGLQDSSAYFMPGGQKIVFDAETNQGLDLYTVVPGVGQPAALIPTETGTYFASPIVVSNGTKIFCDKMAGGTNLWEMNADGTDAHQIADTTLFSDPMHWKP